MRKDEFIDYIQKTFSEYPDYLRDGVVDEDSITHCYDAVKLFSGKSWIELMDSDLYHSEDAVMCITKPAFSYYIAAYLRLFIESYYEADALVDTVLNMLTPPVRNGIPSTTWIGKNLDCFSCNKKVIIAFTFQYLCNEYCDQNAERALKIYWGQYLNESLLIKNEQSLKKKGNKCKYSQRSGM
ncbi:hypothetical protein ACP3BO_002026 [Citrobacter freundii]